MTSKLLAAIVCMGVTMVAGCNKSSENFDDVGETRVFDEQTTQTAKAKNEGTSQQSRESVPAPLPLTELTVNKSQPVHPAPARQAEAAPAKKVAESARPVRRVLIGEMDIDN